jgi:hypothetical protein
LSERTYLPGDKIEGEIIRWLGTKYVLDTYVSRFRIRLKDGSIHEASSDQRVVQVERFEATLGHPLFCKDGRLFPIGGSGPWMFHLKDIREPVAPTPPQPAMPPRPSRHDWPRRVGAFIHRMFEP